MRPHPARHRIRTGGFARGPRIRSTGGEVDYLLLGPVEVRQAGIAVAVGGPRQQALLAAMVLRANRVCGVGYLTESVWEHPPVAPESNLRTHVARLRQRLREPGEPDSRLVTRPGGYLLRVQPGESDVDTFTALTEPKLDTGADAESIATRLERALALWRGAPLEGLLVGERLAVELARLTDRRVEVALRYAAAAGELGRYDRIIARLRPLCAEHPLREELWAQVILAFHRSGRQAEAREVYRQARDRLASELGVAPGPQLRQLRQRLLAGEPGADTVPLPAPVVNVHRQLPMEIPEFTNRDAELRRLEAVADPGQTDPAVRVVTIEGMAGVGKTRLTIQAAHRMVRRGWFADIQLWASLHGFDPRRAPMDPADVLDNFLRVLGVPGGEVPIDPDARAALYRDRLAGRRALVVLDNAASEDQVRPLLPGDPGGLVLITSRRSLAKLEGVESIPLTVLGPAESVLLQARIAGPDRIAAEPDSAARVATLCGHLPIALSLAARRLRTRPTWSVADLARRLERGRGGGDEFDSDQQVRATFATSYQALPAQPRRVFRLLGLHPGHQFTAASTAALAGLSLERAENTLEYLLDEHLLHQAVPGRYSYHDLVRGYAADRALADEPAPARRAALTGLVTWYLAMAMAAGRAIDPLHRLPHVPEPAIPAGRPQPGFADREAALAWFEAERGTLTAAVQLAADLESDALCWHLATSLLTFFYLRSYWSDWVGTHRTALAAATRAGDLRGQAAMLRGLGNVYGDLHRLPESIAAHRRAQRLLVELDDQLGQAWNLNNLAVAQVELGRYAEAGDCLRAALPMFVATQDRHGEAICRSNLADTYRELGELAAAAEQLRRALDIQAEIGDRAARRFSLNVLADIHAETGDHERARAGYQEFLDICLELGDRRGAARAHTGLGQVHDAAGRPDLAVPHWQAAVDIFDLLGSPQAAQIRARLAANGMS